MNKMQKSSGFTLVELLVTVTILAILAVAGLVALNPLELMRKTNDTNVKAAAAEVIGASERFMISSQSEDLDAGVVALGTTIDAVTGVGASLPLLIDGLVANNELKTGVTKSKLYDIAGDYGGTFQKSTGGDSIAVCFTPQSVAVRTEASTADAVACPVAAIDDLTAACRLCIE